MFRIHKWLQPETVEEAYALLIESRNNAVIGGGAFLKMGSKVIPAGIDLSKLNLRFIEERNGFIEIGAMATLRDIETNALLKENFCGMVPAALRPVVGVQFRNTVTVGASVFSRYGFSDLMTALLVLKTEVELHKGGRMPLEVFLERNREKDILTKIYIEKTNTDGAYISLRNSYSDYSVLNAAVSCTAGQWRIAVGARPMGAKVAQRASDSLLSSELTEESINQAGVHASEELVFGSNMRGTAQYRKAMCAVLVKRGIMEVLECR